MKLSLDEKTLIIIGIFAICLLFLYNLNEDDKNFNRENIIEEESGESFKNTVNIESENVETVINIEKEDRETAMDKYREINESNEHKINGILKQSQDYYDQITKLHVRNGEEKTKLQAGIVTNLIDGQENNADPAKNFDSYLTYNGDLLRNSLLNTASSF